MSITQVSKIQVRVGLEEDLPQLSVGEFGLATDTNRLFIGTNNGNIIGPVPDNIEIMTLEQAQFVAGNSGWVQYNWDNQLSASNSFTFNPSTNTLTVLGTIVGNVQGNISGNLVVPGQDNWVLYNDTGNAAASGAFQFDNAANIMTVTGNIVANLFVGNGASIRSINGANVSEVPLANTAKTVITAAQPNITSVGALTGLSMAGDIIPAANIAYDLGNNTRRFKDIYLSNSTIYLGEGTMSSPGTSGNVVFSGNLVANGATLNGDLIVTGNITGAGNINIITGNSGEFFGDATGAGALYTGVIGATLLPNVIIQSTGFTDFYTQVNLQNKKAGVNASADYVITADDGDDTNYFLDIGLGSSTFNDPEYTAVAAHDGWMFVQGNSISPGSDGGNLIIGSRTPGRGVKIVAGGPNIANIAAVFNAPFTPATTANTGTFVVDGGIGVDGNIVSSGNITATTFVGNFQGNISGNIVAPGANTQILYNNDGAVAASPSLTFSGSNLTVGGRITGTIFSGNASGLSAITGANVVGAVAFATTANAVDGANVTGTVANANRSNFANSVSGANVTGAVSFATTANSVAGANVAGAVANAAYASLAASVTSVNGANVVGPVAVANLAYSIAGANVTGAVSFATTANSVAGANVTGAVSFATTANSVAGANVSGTVAFSQNAQSAEFALQVAGANVTGQVPFAATANSVAGANVSGSVANATYANVSGTSVSVPGGNVTGTVANATYAITSGTSVSVPGGNITGTVANATYAITSGTSVSVPGGNVTGAVGFATTANFVSGSNVGGQVAFAGVANSVSVSNVAGIGNVAVLNRDGSSTTVLYGDGVFRPIPTPGQVANANYSNFAGTAFSVAGGNVTGAVATATAAVTAGTVTTAAQPNITSLGTLSSLTVTNKITAGQLQGDGGNISNITGANVSGTVASANNATNANNATRAGTVTTAAQPNITSVGTLTSLSVSSIIVGSVNGSAGTAGTVTTNAQPNITSLGTLSSLSVTGPAIIGNVITTILTTGNAATPGSITGNWILTSGSRMMATYADLAENYVADDEYESGTVLIFGGEHEVTIANTHDSIRVAGVVSTNPAYIMNSECHGENVVTLALTGRVPVKVYGPVFKGDLMVSANNGHAISNNIARAGSIIGKSLENFEGSEGIIEIVVGRV
jgi:hypothetical protein